MNAWLSRAGQGLSNLAWGAYEIAPQPLIDAVGYLKPVSQIFHDRRVPLNIFHGTTKGEKQASLLVAGGGDSIEYMLDRFFLQPPRKETIETVPLSALPRTLRRLRSGADMTIAQVPRLLSEWASSGEYLHVPSWIGTMLPTPDDLEQYARNKRIKEELRPARQNNLRPQLSRDPADFEHFYHEMYLPFAQTRFGRSATIRPLNQLRRLLRNGVLMWICKGEERIAGVLLWQSVRRMVVVSLGMPGTGETARKVGAVPAMYYFGIQHAKACNCTTVDFAGTRPSPGDGVTWFKRKWGVRLSHRRHMKTELLFRWEQPNHAARSFLSHTPLIIREGEDFSLIIESDPKRARDHLWMEGLQRLYILNEAAGGSAPIMPGVSLCDLRSVDVETKAS